MSVYVCVCMCVFKYVSVYVCECIYVSVYMCVCVSECVYKLKHICVSDLGRESMSLTACDQIYWLIPESTILLGLSYIVTNTTHKVPDGLMTNTIVSAKVCANNLRLYLCL